jgi:TPR repeat protein
MKSISLHLNIYSYSLPDQCSTLSSILYLDNPIELLRLFALAQAENDEAFQLLIAKQAHEVAQTRNDPGFFLGLATEEPMIFDAFCKHTCVHPNENLEACLSYATKLNRIPNLGGLYTDIFSTDLTIKLVDSEQISTYPLHRKVLAFHGFTLEDRSSEVTLVVLPLERPLFESIFAYFYTGEIKDSSGVLHLARKWALHRLQKHLSGAKSLSPKFKLKGADAPFPHALLTEAIQGKFAPLKPSDPRCAKIVHYASKHPGFSILLYQVAPPSIRESLRQRMVGNWSSKRLLSWKPLPNLALQQVKDGKWIRYYGSHAVLSPGLDLDENLHRIPLDKEIDLEIFPKVLKRALATPRSIDAVYGKSIEKAFDLHKLFKHFFNVGVCYQNGTGVEKDEKKAFRLYTLAHKGGLLEATNNLGVCYSDGIGVEKDKKKAVEFYTLAHEGGHLQATFNLGWCYENGIGVEKDERKAVELYTLAHKGGLLEATSNLGVCYQHGIGVGKDEERAFGLYRIASEAGFHGGMNQLGFCYEKGIGTVSKPEQAFKWYQKATKGHAFAFYNLGRCYELGIGTKKDAEKGIKYFLRAFRLGARLHESNRAQVGPASLLSSAPFYRSPRPIVPYLHPSVKEVWEQKELAHLIYDYLDEKTLLQLRRVAQSWKSKVDIYRRL